MEIDLKGLNAWVGGGSKGIGYASAYMLASAGASVILVARNEDDLKAACNRLPLKEGVHHEYRVVDYTDTAALLDTVSHVASEKTIHILVNNSGGPAAGPAYMAKPEAYLEAFQQHLIAQQILVQTLLPGMKKASFGRIINIISTSVKQPLHGLGVSNTIRGAVANWSKTLSLELAAWGITVNNVLPGATATERLESIIRTSAAKHQISIEEAEKNMKASIPAGRFANPEEVAAAVVFLASRQAAYINGINVPVDGGRTGCL